MYDPKGGKGMVAALKKNGGVNHSHNDESTIAARQADPHSHALVLDPYVGTVAYVPDLGKDLIREFYYDREGGAIEMEMNFMPSGLCTGKPDGPRYISFHPKNNIAYVVNELSSTIAVFEVDKQLLKEISEAAKAGEKMDRFKGRTTLRLIQSIATIPSAFPNEMNTCGRICAHPSGRFVVVSNRGHQSIAIYKVKSKGPQRGHLSIVGYFHTRGETPRHFQFDATGQYLIVANQDSDSIAVFSFNLGTGEIKYTGNEYHVPSPNFVCNCPTYQDDEDDSAEDEEVYNVVVANRKFKSQESAESDCESESSTVPVHVDTSKDLHAQLASANETIAQLKKQLGLLTTTV
jgi:6-phosphogluconolactonase (cycloisomerase 2 family)